jgi:dTDP-4-amino-4,6-dideoxygalactose transaminase
MDAFVALCEAEGIWLVEDACQAHGAKWNGNGVGSFGVVGCFSFYPGKNLGGLGDAGIVVTRDPEIVERVKSLRDHGRSCDDRNIHLSIAGTDRMDALQARMLSLKLPLLAEWNSRRNAILETYRRHLTQPSTFLFRDDPRARSVTHHVVVQIDNRDRVLRELHSQGVGASVHYPVPCHQQPAMVSRIGHKKLSNAERACKRILSLPCTPDLTDAQIATIAHLVNALAIGQCSSLEYFHADE